MADHKQFCDVLISHWSDEDQMLVFGSISESARFRFQLGVMGKPSIGGEWCATLEQAKKEGREQAERLGFKVRAVIH